MYVCHACGYDFREAGRKAVFFPNEELRTLFDSMLLSLGKPADEAGPFDLGFYAVMHQFCRLMGTRQNKGRLEGHIAEQLEMTLMSIPLGRKCIEQRRRAKRHQWLLFALWLMADLQPRLQTAWLAKVVRYNLMLKDFDDPPGWYQPLVDRFCNWRKWIC